MKRHNRFLTIDSNVIIAALRTVEPDSKKCKQVLAKACEQFVLTEPSIIYQEVCGTLARKTNLHIANEAKKQMDLMINPKLLINCDKNLCTQAFGLCLEHNIYAIDALYLQVALRNNAIIVSLDKEDFIDKLNKKKLPIKAYNVSEFLS